MMHTKTQPGSAETANSYMMYTKTQPGSAETAK